MANVYKDKKKGTYYYVESGFWWCNRKKWFREIKKRVQTRKEAIQAYNELMNDYGKMAFKPTLVWSYGEYFESIFLPWYRGKSGRNKRMRIVYRQCVCILNRFTKKAFCDYAYTGKKWQNELMKTMSNAYVRNIYGLFSHEFGTSL